MDDKFHSLWCERYRPQSLNELILSEENRKFFSSITEDIPHLLFVGPSGIGKSTLAKIIVQDILQCQYLYINASDENGIDTIRNKVINFAQTRSIDGKVKVIVLDESDQLSQDAQGCLRNIIEEYAAYTRFIFTANFKHKISTALQSRCQPFDLTPPIQDIVPKVIGILVKEKIKVDASQKQNLSSLIKDSYPDIRKVINAIQKHCSSGELIITNSKVESEVITNVQKFIRASDPMGCRKYLIENDTLFQADYTNLLRTILNHVFSGEYNDDFKREAIITIGDHLVYDTQVVDKEINAFVCICKLTKLIP